MLISTKGRYALRVMIDIWQHQEEGRVPLREVSERQGISPKYLESIVAVLQKGQMVSSSRGKGGGYILAKKPADYKIGDILRLTENSLAPVQCLVTEENLCPRRDTCSTLPLWEKLDTLVNDYLDSVTLEDLIEGRC